MKDYAWETHFLQLFDRSLERYQSGDSDLDHYYNDGDQAFLKSIGYKPREFFDFVEDYSDEEEPSPAAAALIAAVRRDYLQIMQHGKESSHVVHPDDLPGRKEELEGIPWLPRIIVKAEAKLRGELDPDIMFSCGGDRAFLREHDIHPADFLRVVWAANGDQSRIARYVKTKEF